MDTWQLGVGYRTADGVFMYESVRELKGDEYTTFRAAVRDGQAYALRDTFVFVVANYEQFQTLRSQILADFLRTPPADRPTAEIVQYSLRVAFLNWLLSVRTFLDHTGTDLSRRYGRASEELRSFRGACSRAFDSDDFSYRFTYKLRNYAQHVGFPPIGGHVSGYRTDDGEDHVEMTVVLKRDVLLEQFDEWGSRVRSDLRAQPDEIPVDSCMERVKEDVTELAANAYRSDLPLIRRGAEFVRALRVEAQAAGKGDPMVFLAKPGADPNDLVISSHMIPAVTIGPPRPRRNTSVRSSAIPAGRAPRNVGVRDARQATPPSGARRHSGSSGAHSTRAPRATQAGRQTVPMKSECDDLSPQDRRSPRRRGGALSPH